MYSREEIIRRCNKELNARSHCNGILLQVKTIKNIQYYTMIRKGSNGCYIFKNIGKLNDFVMEVSGYRYLKKVVRWLSANKDLQAIDPNDPKIKIGKAYRHLPAFVFEAIGVPSVEAWKKKHQTDESFRPEGRTMEAGCGIMVRSKSEMMIADALTRWRIPFVYEPRYYVNGVVLHPDFLILVPGIYLEKIWEHFGRMDDASYWGNFMDKLSLHESLGFRLNKNLLATFEDSVHPLSAKTIGNVIKDCLLP